MQSVLVKGEPSSFAFLKGNSVRIPLRAGNESEAVPATVIPVRQMPDRIFDHPWTTAPPEVGWEGIQRSGKPGNLPEPKHIMHSFRVKSCGEEPKLFSATFPKKGCDKV